MVKQMILNDSEEKNSCNSDYLPLQRHSNSNIKYQKRPWTAEEDNLLLELVKQYGPRQWSQMAKRIPLRQGKQCRERWYNHLSPNVNKQEWSQKQQWMLFLAHTVVGNSWSEISKVLPGRTDNTIKNYWNCAVKKFIPQMQVKLKQVFENGINVESCVNHEAELLQMILNGQVGKKKILAQKENSSVLKMKSHQQVQKLKTKTKYVFGNLNMDFETPKKIIFDAEKEDSRDLGVDKENVYIPSQPVHLESPSNYLSII